MFPVQELEGEGGDEAEDRSGEERGEQSGESAYQAHEGCVLYVPHTEAPGDAPYQEEEARAKGRGDERIGEPGGIHHTIEQKDHDGGGEGENIGDSSGADVDYRDRGREGGEQQQERHRKGLSHSEGSIPRV